jgi:peptide/nickel transport system ATP-binding protein
VSLLDVAGLEVSFRTGSGPARAVQGVSFSVQPGERLGLVGESGSGKSTTVLALMQLIRPPGQITAGQVRLDGQDLLQLPPRAMRAVRAARIALVPQGAMNSLNPVLDCGTQIDDLMQAHGALPRPGERDAWRAALLAQVGLRPDVARMFPHELSGGMKQRVCIALAIALHPAVILADEPTSALDVIVQKQVLQTLLRVQTLAEGHPAAIVLVGHDMGLMAQFATRIGVMYAGRLVEIAPVRDLFAAPQHPYTRMLIASLPSFTARLQFRGISGVAPSIINPPPGCPFHPRCPVAGPSCAVEMPEETVLPGDRRVRCHYPERATDAA